MPDVVIVGGGIIGACCALELSRAGAEVTLIERDGLAAGASGRNQGWLGDPSDPVNAPLYEPSLARYLEAADRAPTRAWIDRESVGYLSVALPGDEDVQMDRARPLDMGELRRLVPSIADDAERAWLIDEGGRRVDPMALTVGMALLAREAGATVRHHLGARALFESQDRIGGVVTDEGTIDADEVVIAAGPWSNELLWRAGARLPIWPGRGWIARLRPGSDGPKLTHFIERVGWRTSLWHADAVKPPPADVFTSEGVSAGGGALINPHPDGSVLVGSSREPAIGPEPADPDVVRRQLADAIRLIPSLGSAAVESTWWGIRPMSPDDRPIIGRMRDGLIVATGHGSEGVITGYGTAELVRSLVMGQPASFDPSPFDPLRFG